MNLWLHLKNATDDKSLTDRSLFRQLAGALLSLAVTLRPDIALAVNLISQACKILTLQQKEYYAI